MDQGLTYHEALKILDARQGRLATMLGEAASNGQIEALSLRVLQDEIITSTQGIFREMPEWRTGLSRFTRSERLAAAHTVLVVSSYFDVLAKETFPASMERLFSEQPIRYRELGASTAIIDFLLHVPLALPEPHLTHADVREHRLDEYRSLSYSATRFLADMATARDLTRSEEDGWPKALARLPGRALTRYDHKYRLLEAENPEFATWTGLAGRDRLGTGLSGMASLLAEMAIRRPGQRARLPLSMSYQAALSEPIIGAGQAPDGVVLPALGEAYVDPVCRVAEPGPGDRPSEPEWWQERTLISDAGAFLAGYLTSRRAVALPLVVLGEPGSGKSKLAEVLVARLPEHDFLPVLVPLRDVGAESMIAEQIEQAIGQGPGRQTSWHDLLEATAGALPVVVLDGLDELIQATAVNRYDYLEQVRDFQRRQAQIGRPVAVIVTSRTIVADLVRFPLGSVAIQLQPFTEDQVRRWLQIWGRHNSAVLAGRGLRPLTAEAALTHRELASQPLLLLLVAVFDAAHNALQREGASLSQAELYERLLTEFAQREIAKTAVHRALPAGRQRQLASREVQRLAVVALAMFARGQQAASEAELNQDLPVLFPEDGVSRDDAGRTLTPAQRATGRFFFIHRSEARLGNDRARSYEFLHATFGEFLVARLAVSALRDVAARREAALHSLTAAGSLDDGFLYAALSFSSLVSRTPIVSFTTELLRQLPDDERARCREVLGDLIRGSLFPAPSRSFQHYEPVRCPISRRIACYSANLVVMLVLLAGTVNVSEFCGVADTAKNWAQYGHLWQSTFGFSDWRHLISTVRARVSRGEGPINIELALEDGSPVSPLDSIVITPDPSDSITNFDALLTAQPGVTYAVEIPAYSVAGRVFRDLAFTPSWHASLMLLQAVPYLRAAGGEIRYQLDDGTLALPGYLLSHLDHTRGAPPKERYEYYKAHTAEIAVTPELATQLSDRLRQDLPNFPVSWATQILQKLALAPPTKAGVMAINALWQQAESASDRQRVRIVVTMLQASWPDELLAMLDKKMEHLTDEPQLNDQPES